MTSKPLVFQNQHLQWQQRVGKERGTELRIKDENLMFKTFTDGLPKYLERMDRKKQRQFRGAHPQRYQADTSSIASTNINQQQASFSLRSKSIGGDTHLKIRAALDRRSQGGSSSRASRLSTSQRLLEMSTRASGRMMPNQQQVGDMPHTPARKGKVSLKDFIKENKTYDDVVEQINRKIALKRAIDQANGAIQRSIRPSDVSSRATNQDFFANDMRSNATSQVLRDQDARSRATNHSNLSLISMSQRVASQGLDGKSQNQSETKSRTTAAGSVIQHSLGSRTELRSTAHSLVDTLQMQLQRERQQKRKLLEHLQMLEVQTPRK